LSTALLDGRDVDPGLAIGLGQPHVAWTIDQRDRIYNVLLAGGQGSGKSSLLMRLGLNDMYSSNTATVVLDMKGSLSERLLRLAPPDTPKRWWDHEREEWAEGTKRVWYLDLARPGFGLTPLQVEPGWERMTLADEFSRIADAVCRALLDLYPNQIMGSSEDLIERAVVGTMAIAWFEHDGRCQRDGVDPTTRGFSGSFEVLSEMFAPTDRFDEGEANDNSKGRPKARPNRWHQAAGRACQRLPNLDRVADTLLYEIPRQARDNLGDIAKRMEAPANKIRPLVGAAASVRRFVGHPERLSLRSVIEAHDTLIVNPRIELIGEDQAAILTNFIVHMLDLQLKRQVATPGSQRPRVSLIIDEAHRLITDTLITMVATHREAGLTLAAALQYVSQLGADEPSGARREKILKGVGNLLQTKVLFRMSDSEDADRHTQIFRSVYETMIRADPTSRARLPFDPSRMQTLADHHALVSLVSSTGGETDSGLLDATQGATRLPAFTTKTYAMPDLEQLSGVWRDHHLKLQGEMFSSYPEDMSSLAIRDVPAGLSGLGVDDQKQEAKRERDSDAREVAEQTIGRKPEGAMRKDPPPARQAPQDGGGDRHAADANGSEAPIDRELFERPGAADGEKPGTPEYDPALFPGAGGSTSKPPKQRAAGVEQVGGVRVERSEQPEKRGERLVADSPVLGVACRPTDRPLPDGDAAAPATDAGQDALRAAAALDSISGLSEWRLAGEEVREQARKASQQARDQAFAEARGAERSEEEATRLAERRGRHGAQQILERHGDAAWRTPAKELELGDADAHALELIARLRVAAPRLLALLLEEPAAARTVRERVDRLFEAGLIARADVGLSGRRGRPPALYAVAQRGLDYLRLRRAELADETEVPRYLDKDRKPPSAGKGSEVPHELAIQVALVALRQYGGAQTRVHWHTTDMPGGRWDVGMVHRNHRDRTLRLADLLPGSGYNVQGEQLDAPATLAPDLSVQLQGQVADGRAVIDLLLEVDRTGRGAYNAAKYAAYDQFLGGWCLRTRRFGRERATRPIVVFVARRAKTVLTLLHRADRAMTLGFGPPGGYDPSGFEYPGRAHTAFTCMEWLLAGEAMALRLPALPPQVRGSETELRPERVALLPEEWWPRPRRGGGS